MSRGPARRRWAGIATGAAIACLSVAVAREAGTEPAPAFSSEMDAFAYLHQVARHPRCVNCHGMYRGDGVRVPTVGDSSPSAPHPMNVTERHNPTNSVLGIRCTSCHGTKNSPEGGSPGVADGCPEWQMPTRPITVLSPAISKQELCTKWRNAVWESLKLPPVCPGPKPTVAAKFFVDHIAHDHLIEWAFTPGDGREPAPGSFKRLKAAAEKWAPTLEDRAWCDTIKEERPR